MVAHEEWHLVRVMLKPQVEEGGPRRISLLFKEELILSLSDTSLKFLALYIF